MTRRPKYYSGKQTLSAAHLVCIFDAQHWDKLFFGFGQQAALANIGIQSFELIELSARK